MPNFSENEDLEIGDNYTRGMLCDLMKMPYSHEIERIVYESLKWSARMIFVTLINPYGFIYGKTSDTTFLTSKYGNTRNVNEELLFIRNNDSTGFYYFGRSKYSGVLTIAGYEAQFYCLELLDTKFSKVNGIEVPELYH